MSWPGWRDESEELSCCDCTLRFAQSTHATYTYMQASTPAATHATYAQPRAAVVTILRSGSISNRITKSRLEPQTPSSCASSCSSPMDV
eukprot:4525124-Pyramimonas_sp.AAC.1